MQILEVCPGQLSDILLHMHLMPEFRKYPLNEGTLATEPYYKQQMRRIL